MSAKTKKVEQPDPDPSPEVVTNTAQEVQEQARTARKKSAANYGRNQTILAGESAQDNAARKTILGG